MKEETKNLVKTAVGVLVFLAGIIWYIRFFKSLWVVFAGTFGLILIFAGLGFAWLSYEDYKISKPEKEESKGETE
ncbi:MAG: hypothetical protein ACE5K4_05915 [Candidatus Hydrothermarchaeota archaeon]